MSNIYSASGKTIHRSSFLGLSSNLYNPGLRELAVLCMVADPYSYSFDTDPDPAFSAEYRTGSRVFMTKNWKKNLQLKKLNFF
jgi:hypothetical protein